MSLFSYPYTTFDYNSPSQFSQASYDMVPSMTAAMTRGCNQNNLYLKGLPKGTTNKKLTKIFGRFGRITSVKLGLNGTGFVRYVEPIAARNAIDSLNGQLLLGSVRPLEISYAHSDIDIVKFSLRRQQRTMEVAFKYAHLLGDGSSMNPIASATLMGSSASPMLQSQAAPEVCGYAVSAKELLAPVDSGNSSDSDTPSFHGGSQEDSSKSIEYKMVKSPETGHLMPALCNDQHVVILL